LSYKYPEKKQRIWGDITDFIIEEIRIFIDDNIENMDIRQFFSAVTKVLLTHFGNELETLNSSPELLRILNREKLIYNSVVNGQKQI
jgi:hypothetical protein